MVRVQMAGVQARTSGKVFFETGFALTEADAAENLIETLKQYGDVELVEIDALLQLELGTKSRVVFASEEGVLIFLRRTVFSRKLTCRALSRGRIVDHYAKMTGSLLRREAIHVAN